MAKRLHRSSSGSSSSSFLNSDHKSSKQQSDEEVSIKSGDNYTSTYMMYKRHQKERLKARQATHQKKMEMQTNHSLEKRKVDLKEFPNYKKKLVILYIPLEVAEDEISQFFYTILSGSSKEEYTQSPITKVTKYEQLGFVTLEFRKRQDADICLLLDEVKEFSSEVKVKMRIFRVKRFILFWNDLIDKGYNPMAPLLEGANSNFKDQQ